MRISDWSSDVFSSDLRVPEFQWFRRGSTTRLLRHRTVTMLGTPAMATRENNRKTLHWRRRLHQSRPIGDGSACDAASVIMRHPATPAPCGKGLAATSVTATAASRLLHGAWAVHPQRPEIGRATGRGRGLQYEYNSMVALALTKKTEKAKRRIIL